MSGYEEQELTDIDAALDANPDATSSEVFQATRPYDERAIASVAASRALAGGGGGGSSPFTLTSVHLSSAELLALDTNPIELLAAPGGRFYYVLLNVVLHYRFGATPYSGEFSANLGYGSTVEEITAQEGLLGEFGLYVPPPPNPPDWEDGVDYEIGDRVSFNGNSYICLVANTGDDSDPGGNQPSITPADWSDLGSLPGTGGWLLTKGEDTYVYDTISDSWMLRTNNAPLSWPASAIENKAISVCNPRGPVADGDGTLSVRLFYATINGSP